MTMPEQLPLPFKLGHEAAPASPDTHAERPVILATTLSAAPVDAATALSAADPSSVDVSENERSSSPKISQAQPWVLPTDDVPQGAARPTTLRACLAFAKTQASLPEATLKAMCCAVSRLEKLVRIGNTSWPTAAADRLPAEPEQLRAILEAVLPARHNLSRKRWANIRSDLRALLLRCGWVSPESRHGPPREGAWDEVVTVAVADKAGCALAPFARFCETQGITPPAVTAEVVLAYEAWRRAETLWNNSRQAALAVRKKWAELARGHPELGITPFTLPSRVPWKAARIENLPPTFADELGRYLEQLRNPDRLNPRHGRKRAELTVQHARRALLRSAAYLEQSGVAREEITSLSVLVQPTALRMILERVDADRERDPNDDTWSYASVQLAQTLLTLARRWVDLPPEDLTAVKEMCHLVKVPHGGLSRRVRDRLAQFATPEELQELFDLPERGFAHAEEMLKKAQRSKSSSNTKPGGHAAKLHESCLALKLLLVQPLRRADLARLDINEHFRFDRRGRVHRIVIRAQKTRREIDIEVPTDLARAIERHLKDYRPLLVRHESCTALFPGEDGGARGPDALGRQITKLAAQQLGVKLSPHLTRHLAATLLINDDSANLPVVQRLLGHGTLSRTEAMYGVTRTTAAQKRYGEIVDEMRDAAGRRDRGRKTPRQ